MRVRQYGITYDRLQPEHLELVRYWRNQSHIRAQMQFTGYITPAQQRSWFDSINNPYNYYFLMEWNNKKIGLINCKDTEPNSRIAEGGIFIWDEKVWGTPVPAFASLSMLEAVFEVFKTGDTSLITVKRDNKRALDFNLLLGHEVIPETRDDEFVKLILTREKYLHKSSALKRAALIFCGGEGKMEISGEPNSNQVEEINRYLQGRSIS